MDRYIDQVMSWFEPYVGKEIEIQKEEAGDQDRIRLNLERVDLGENECADLDDYVAKQALLLHGDGVLLMPDGEEQLPQQVYEIPITEEMRVTQSINALTLHSERAIYQISSNQKSVN